MSDPSAAAPESPAEIEADDDVMGDGSEVADEEDVDGETIQEVLWTSDDALSFQEARRLTSQRGATLVLFAGDTEVGKTSAMVELWTSLLSDGRLGGVSIAGSNNALAFELRSFDSRIESGTNTTARTDSDTEGFLHLSVMSPRGRLELLFADYQGEHFTRIREGVEVVDELEWIGRVDRLAIFVDGEQVASPAFAEVAYTRAQRLLWKLRDCQECNPRLRTALVLTKAELVDEDRLADVQSSFDALLTVAREIDPQAPLLKISARPKTGEKPIGLDVLLDWVCMEDRPAFVANPVLIQPTRSLGRLR
jgi:hypothetical protein